MRTLSLLRHAKSSWDDASLDDHERPLNKRGTKDAPRVGSFLQEHGLVPELVLCSDAVRARATLTLVLSAFDGPAPTVEYDPRLYMSEPAAILEVLTRTGPEVGHCLIVGHNPGLHALALVLTGSGERKALAGLAAKFPTAALAVIDLDAERWDRLKPGTGRLRLFATPKDL